MFPPPGGLPDPGMEPRFPALAGGYFTTEPPGKPAKSTRGSLKRSAKFRMMEGKMGDCRRTKFRAYVVFLGTRISIIHNC